MDKATLQIEKVIQEHIQNTLEKKHMPELPQSVVATDNFAEIIEKLVILHIRTWMLEDAVGQSNDLAEIGRLKKKIDICFKQKRPQYIEAINALMHEAITKGRALSEESVKHYAGFEDESDQ